MKRFGEILLLVTLLATSLDAKGQQSVDDAEARQQSRECDRGSAVECLILAERYTIGNGVPRDRARAAQLYDRACNFGNAEGCGKAGLHSLFDSEARDPARAAQYLERACKGGEGHACYVLGTLYRDGDGVPRDPAQAARLLGQECKARHAAACEDLKALEAVAAGAAGQTTIPAPDGRGDPVVPKIKVEGDAVSLELDDGEYMVPFTNGCKRVIWLSREQAAADVIKGLSGHRWSGKCRLGLAHGKGTESWGDSKSGFESEYHFGRRSPWVSLDWRGNGTSNGVSVPTLDRLDTPDLLRQASPALNQFGYEWLLTFVLDGVMHDVRLFGACTSGMESEAEGYPKAEQGKVRRCREGSTLYRLRLFTLGKAVSHLCPDTRDARSCMPLYREMIAPYRDGLAAIIRDAPAGHARWLARQEALLAAAEQAMALHKRQEAERRAQAEHLRAAEQARQAEAATQAEAAFRRRLAQGNAGQLFSLADELRRAGRDDQAREALRALLERFPDAPLAPNAAALLTGASATGQTTRTAGRASAPASRAATTASRPARSCESLLGDTAQAANAGRNLLDWTQELELSVLVRQHWLRMARELPACQRDTAFTSRLRQLLAEKQAECRQEGGRQCDGGADARPASYRQAMEAAIAQTLVAGREPATTATAPAGTAARCARTPDQELAVFDAEVAALGPRCPQPSGVVSGSRAELQRLYWLMSESLKLLEPRRACMGPHYETNRVGLVNARDSAKRGCDQLGSVGACPLACPN